MHEQQLLPVMERAVGYLTRESLRKHPQRNKALPELLHLKKPGLRGVHRLKHAFNVLG
jgi:hypothetical protein